MIEIESKNEIKKTQSPEYSNEQTVEICKLLEKSDSSWAELDRLASI